MSVPEIQGLPYGIYLVFFLSFGSPVILTLSCIAEDKIQLSDVCIKVLSFNGNLRTNETIVKDGFVKKKRTMDERLGSFREMKKR